MNLIRKRILATVLRKKHSQANKGVKAKQNSDRLAVSRKFFCDQILNGNHPA